MENTIDRLLQHEIVEETDGELQVSDAFLERLDRLRTDTDAELRERLVVKSESEIDRRLLDVASSDRKLLVTATGIVQVLPEFQYEALVRATQYVDILRYDPPPSDGAPDGFLPVPGSRLGPYLELNRAAVVYVWRNDCDPCDIMQEELGAIQSDIPDGIALFTVYGPECSALLQEDFEVYAGPTTLFTVDGDVDSRLQGAHYRSPIEHEIEQIATSL